MEFIQRMLSNLEWAIAGLIGAFIAAPWHKQQLPTRRDYIVFLMTGLASAHFLTGLAAAYFGIVEPRSVAGVGFMIGAFGGSLMAAIIRAIHTADLWALIKSKVGGGNNDIDGP